MTQNYIQSKAITLVQSICSACLQSFLLGLFHVQFLIFCWQKYRLFTSGIPPLRKYSCPAQNVLTNWTRITDSNCVYLCQTTQSSFHTPFSGYLPPGCSLHVWVGRFLCCFGRCLSGDLMVSPRICVGRVFGYSVCRVYYCMWVNVLRLNWS